MIDVRSGFPEIGPVQVASSEQICLYVMYRLLNFDPTGLCFDWSRIVVRRVKNDATGDEIRWQR